MTHRVLAGRHGPRGGSEGPFKIGATAEFLVHADGTDPFGDEKGQMDAACAGGDCAYPGTVRGFRGPK